MHCDDRGVPHPARHGNRPGAVPGDPEDHRARRKSVAPLYSRGTVDHRGHRDPEGVPATDRRSCQVTELTRRSDDAALTGDDGACPLCQDCDTPTATSTGIYPTPDTVLAPWRLARTVAVNSRSPDAP